MKYSSVAQAGPRRAEPCQAGPGQPWLWTLNKASAGAAAATTTRLHLTNRAAKANFLRRRDNVIRQFEGETGVAVVKIESRSADAVPRAAAQSAAHISRSRGN